MKPTTFLEYVCCKLMGPPARRGQPGESFWPCPKCGHPRWHTRPSRPGCKDRFNCWRCDFWGDAYDLLRHCYPSANYGDHKARLHDWFADYQRSGAAGRVCGPNGPGPDTPDAGAPSGPHWRDTDAGGLLLPSPGESAGSRGYEPPLVDDRPSAVARAFGRLSAEQQALLAEAAEIARKANVCLNALGQWAWHVRREVEERARCAEAVQAELDARHRAECQDPECNGPGCRAKRGLPPLTPEEQAALHRRAAEGRQEERAHYAAIREKVRRDLASARDRLRNGRARGR